MHTSIAIHVIATRIAIHVFKTPAIIHSLIKQKYEIHTKSMEWHAIMSYQTWYVMHTIDLDALN